MKKQITLRIDEDVLVWFKSSGRGYQSRMNDALRSWISRGMAPVATKIQESVTTATGGVSFGNGFHVTGPPRADNFFKPMPKKGK